jgi:hypothetical protein
MLNTLGHKDANEKMQIKTMLRFHLTPVRMVIIKNTHTKRTQQMLVRM